MLLTRRAPVSEVDSGDPVLGRDLVAADVTTPGPLGDVFPYWFRAAGAPRLCDLSRGRGKPAVVWAHAVEGDNALSLIQGAQTVRSRETRHSGSNPQAAHFLDPKTRMA